MWTPPLGFLKELGLFIFKYFHPPLIQIIHSEIGTLKEQDLAPGISCRFRLTNETDKAVLVRSIAIVHNGTATETVNSVWLRVITQHGTYAGLLPEDQLAIPPFQIPGMDSVVREAMFKFNGPIDITKVPIELTMRLECVGRKPREEKFLVTKL